MPGVMGSKAIAETTAVSGPVCRTATVTGLAGSMRMTARTQTPSSSPLSSSIRRVSIASVIVIVSVRPCRSQSMTYRLRLTSRRIGASLSGAVMVTEASGRPQR